MSAAPITPAESPSSFFTTGVLNASVKTRCSISARPRVYKALGWIAYGIVRLAMGLLGYGGNEWFRGARPRPPALRVRQRSEE